MSEHISLGDWYNLRLENERLSWAYWNDRTEENAVAENKASYAESDAFCKYMQGNPHPDMLNAFIVPVAGMYDGLNELETELYEEYLRLRASNEDAGDVYYDLFDKGVDKVKEVIAKGNLGSEFAFNESKEFSTHETILQTVERMATIASTAIKNKIKNEVPARRQWTEEEFKSKCQQIVDSENIEVLVSNTDGSFMTNIGDQVKIHIAIKNPTDMADALAHELGHGMYHIRCLYPNTMCRGSNAFSLSLHESSSLFHEMVLSGFDNVADTTSRNKMKRLTSDTLHYIIHIYIRLKMEDKILRGGLKARDIPKEWNALCLEYLGEEPVDNWEGFLQDVHWNSLSFGYFHSYAIGLLHAIKMYMEVKDELPAYNDDWMAIVNNVTIPKIMSVYGEFNEGTKDIFNTINPSIEDTLKLFEEFVNTNFNVI